ncbi:flagella synthesis protein FlgN [Kosakonia arachidis]|uniref:Flagella synthesis protein FlgN n=1 Tax=Kosakonia arachidis TaxID=551989 RepID=A0A1I7E8I1_9ENTR|nr:flagellar export chaperone FlgN [Kosakonia arachidis]SFU20276.1 flagella synthesis protein FlgN [Kosakonia arachidis]
MLSENGKKIKQLHTTLSKMQQMLEELQSVLSEELNQLKRAQVNPVSLQMLSDNKSRLLSTINFYDEQRKSEEQQLNLAAPYPQHIALKTIWEKIISSASKAKLINSSAFPLIEVHMQKAVTLKSMVRKIDSGVSLYSASGKAQKNLMGKSYDINI